MEPNQYGLSPILPNDVFMRSRLEAIFKRDWRTYLLTFGGHERLFPLLSIQASMTDTEYWSSLGEVWQHTEFAAPNSAIWEFLLFCNRDPVGALAIMGASEREVWDALPRVMNVFRGQQSDEDGKGFSWTLCRKRAEWFAYHRGTARMNYVTNGRWKPGKGVVFAGCVEKDEVLCYLDGRSEQEILVHPESVLKLRRL